MAADDLLARSRARPTAEVLDGLGGVLCRCTGYRKIVEAVRATASGAGRRRAGTRPSAPRSARASPARDGLGQGHRAPSCSATTCRPTARAARCAPSARHTRMPGSRVGDLAPLRARHPGLVRVLTAADVPGQNRYGIYATGKDQPVLADGYVRYRGEAVLALVGDAATVACDRATTSCRSTWDAAAAAARDRRRARPAARRGSTRRRPATSSIEGRSSGWATSTPPWPRPPRPRPGRSRRPTSSTPTSSPRPARRAWSTGASRSSPPPRRRTWTATSWRLILGPARGPRAGHPERLRRRVRRQARPVAPAADRDRRAPARPPGPRASIRVRSRWPRRPSAIRRGSRPRSAPTRRGASPASASTATSTPAPTRRGARRSPTACRSTRWARTRSARCASTTGPSTRTARRPAPSAASASRRRPSPTRR